MLSYIFFHSIHLFGLSFYHEIRNCWAKSSFSYLWSPSTHAFGYTRFLIARWFSLWLKHQCTQKKLLIPATVYETANDWVIFNVPYKLHTHITYIFDCFVFGNTKIALELTFKCLISFFFGWIYWWTSAWQFYTIWMHFIQNLYIRKNWNHYNSIIICIVHFGSHSLTNFTICD